jgi:hypothetical protein
MSKVFDYIYKQEREGREEGNEEKEREIQTEVSFT